MLTINVDKRFEILTGLVVAYVSLCPESIEQFDWIETPDNNYTKELISKLNITKYPHIIEYIKNIVDCGTYSELFLYFDNNMNFKNYTKDRKVFEKGSVDDFSRVVKEIYDNENLETLFIKHQNELAKMKEVTNNILPKNFDINDIEGFYGYKKGEYVVTISALANGGFGFKYNDELNYFKGINFKEGNYSLNNIGFLIDLFHEYSHLYVNELVDKYYQNSNEIELLLEKAINNGLPKCYQNPKTLLYEYLVRTNSIILSSKYLREAVISEDIEWFKEIGFIHIEEFIKLTIEMHTQYKNYEEFYVQEVIPYVKSLSINSLKSK